MSGFDCHTCQRSFRLFQHYQAHMIHSNSHHYCAQCNRDFGDEDAKQKHLRFSQNHFVCGPAQPVTRLTGQTGLFNQCAGQAGRRSALIQHFEAGTCVSGFNLEDVDREFSEYCDINQVFVRREWILPATQIDVLHSDTSGRFPCTSCPKLFRTGPELLAHLQSAKHKNRGFKAYTCPSPHCAKDRFYSLGNLLLHMETTNCNDSYPNDWFDLVDNYLLEAVRQTT
ncbi:hypothetical protein PCANC_14881 [Puccinia coronata f. sp. avenae]|uniref:C2H2-type domain-containing protein n=1 Tax=Puccinia coronata f. sp. avenae TaxID=200324 RepID=A0A2N5UNR2_9BASI|nr:hypothetical protein PCANC_14881 [Puccinia coronata f. sp. avenae]